MTDKAVSFLPSTRLTKQGTMERIDPSDGMQRQVYSFFSTTSQSLDTDGQVTYHSCSLTAADYAESSILL